ncbi:hypothetical protein [Enterococcus phoeniculicola]|jgi:hypothetical protein|uniref:WxL domain-containing protein n=1 Tax=Enterococcus phoeniculicola ATCC BAA-412 TaxID=1158610 RepID=R3WCM6_9ENTE|nr:hypothetical protein [Enterococcus phoeniculicola]EOL45232.1 hypothetical protein UC3_01122 [Enterococcus phoeniculicola ATCC BAA-412]EOT74594.1 hypothetical protein I589_02194 [Enterococcus phoeniculicola ATCC BAA-412]
MKKENLNIVFILVFIFVCFFLTKITVTAATSALTDTEDTSKQVEKTSNLTSFDYSDLTSEPDDINYHSQASLDLEAEYGAKASNEEEMESSSELEFKSEPLAETTSSNTQYSIETDREIVEASTRLPEPNGTDITVDTVDDLIAVLKNDTVVGGVIGIGGEYKYSGVKNIYLTTNMTIQTNVLIGKDKKSGTSVSRNLTIYGHAPDASAEAENVTLSIDSGSLKSNSNNQTIEFKEIKLVDLRTDSTYIESSKKNSLYAFTNVDFQGNTLVSIGSEKSGLTTVNGTGSVSLTNSTLETHSGNAIVSGADSIDFYETVAMNRVAEGQKPVFEFRKNQDSFFTAHSNSTVNITANGTGVWQSFFYNGKTTVAVDAGSSVNIDAGDSTINRFFGENEAKVSSLTVGTDASFIFNANNYAESAAVLDTRGLLVEQNAVFKLKAASDKAQLLWISADSSLNGGLQLRQPKSFLLEKSGGSSVAVMGSDNTTKNFNITADGLFFYDSMDRALLGELSVNSDKTLDQKYMIGNDNTPFSYNGKIQSKIAFNGSVTNSSIPGDGTRNLILSNTDGLVSIGVTKLIVDDLYSDNASYEDSTAITGQSYPGSRVILHYQAIKDDKLVTYVQETVADANGAFNWNLEGHLAAGKDVTVTSEYDYRYKSVVKHIPDEIAPSAEPVNQFIYVGDTMPSNVNELVKNVEDNSKEKVKVSLSADQTQFDNSKVGITQVKVDLEDESKNVTTVIVPVFVGDENSHVETTTKDKLYVIQGNNFTVPTVDLRANKNDEQRKAMVFEKGAVHLFDISKMTEISNDQLDIKGLENFVEGHTTAPFTFSYNDGTKVYEFGGNPVTATITLPVIAFKEVPSAINFDGKIAAFTTDYFPKESQELKISDERGVVTAGDWELQVQCTSFLSETGNENYPNLLWFRSSADAEKQSLLDNASIFSQSGAAEEKIVETLVSWKPENKLGVFIDAQPGELLKGSYQGELTWTINLTP